MIVVGLVLVGVIAMLINLYANGRYEYGMDAGYRQGYANAKANICNKQYFTCNDDKTTK